MASAPPPWRPEGVMRALGAKPVSPDEVSSIPEDQLRVRGQVFEYVTVR